LTIKGLPVVNEATITGVFTSLESMEVDLDTDPLAYGPKRMAAKVAQARGMLTKCERIFLQVSQDLSLYKRMFRTSQLDFDLQKQDLFANDPEVRSGRNVADREAMATMKLRDAREDLIQMEVSIQDLEMVMTVIKAKRADLRDIQSRLREQRSLCESEVSIGAKWGSKAPPGVQTPPRLDAAPHISRNALQQVQAVLADSSEVAISPEDASWMEEDEETSPEILAIMAEVEAASAGNLDWEVSNPTSDPESKEQEAPEDLDAVLDALGSGEETQEEVNPPTEETLGDFLSSTFGGGTPEEPLSIPEVKSDDAVDQIFSAFQPEEAANPSPSLDEVDMDSLIDMFSM